MRDWRSNLGRALSTLGKSLIGAGILPQLGGIPNITLTYIALLGFICDAAGSFFSQLWAVAAVAQISDKVDATATAVATGNPDLLKDQ